MIGLQADWDLDLYDHPEASSSGGSIPNTPFVAEGSRLRSARFTTTSLDGRSSKAKELLRRASQAAASTEVGAPASDFLGRAEEIASPPCLRPCISFDPRAQPREAESGGAVSMELDTLAPEASCKTPFSILSTVELPGCRDPAVMKFTGKAPRMMSHTFSFRASARGGLIALPVIQPERGGSFRVKLLRLQPGLLSHAKCAEEDKRQLCNGVGLLEAHTDVGLASPAAPSTEPSSFTVPVPRALMPCSDHGPNLLARYLEKAQCCFGGHTHEAFGLLSALLGDSPEKENVDDAALLSRASHRFGVWLAGVNARIVGKHLEAGGRGTTRTCLELGPGAQETDTDVGHRLKATFHRLTANSVRGALHELNRASDTASRSNGCGAHFDRLAAILASCGGTVRNGSVERRQWLQRQVLQWRYQSVDELMGPELWRVYCLLAGEVDSVAAEALDWRTTFGMYLWYQTSDDEKPGLLSAVHNFQAVCRKYGSNCLFRPAPPYLLAPRARDARGAALGLEPHFSVDSIDGNATRDPEPYDLQFNVIRAALGLVDWSDLKQFDYVTYSPLPFDVACSWHFCLLLLVLSRPEQSIDATNTTFQQLTHQYCLLLELTGNWEWAVYVALFISDERARVASVRGLLQRHSALPSRANLELPNRPEWACLPKAWIWRGEALRRERAWDWPAAVACWLRSLADAPGGSTESKRAAALVLGFLQMPAMLRHRLSNPSASARAPAGGGGLRVGPPELEATNFAAMATPAKWLLAVLVELEAELNKTEVGRDVLLFMRSWSQAGTFSCPPARLARLCNQCMATKRQVLGIPW